MFVSEARIAANARNAQLSTGPRTPEGKARSRANALKHGLCAEVVVPESPERIRDRAEAWSSSIQPRDGLDAWLVDQAAVLSLRLDRCGRMETGVRDMAALRAGLVWEDDRRHEAAVLGARLARSPAEVVEALRRTPQGCEWLMTRWALLAHSADVHHAWTPEQARLAFDLLGTPAEFRDGNRPGDAIDFDGRAVEADSAPAVVARREIAGLRERRDLVAEIDEAERDRAEADLSDESGPELKRLRRYESDLQRRLRWCLDQIRDPSTDRQPEPPPGPEPAPEEPTMVPEDPAADPGPVELPPPVVRLGVPPIPTPRREKQARKVESRREARRRKLERIRA
jgi:hypothetical protein